VTQLDGQRPGEGATQTPGDAGRPVTRSGAALRYDLEGHRIEDDRQLYTWSWRDELVEVVVKDCWPASPGDASSPLCAVGQTRPELAGHRLKYEYDALGRLFAEEHQGAPTNPNDQASRPFVERKEF